VLDVRMASGTALEAMMRNHLQQHRQHRHPPERLSF
jgi:hypothetical protein